MFGYVIGESLRRVEYEWGKCETINLDLWDKYGKLMGTHGIIHAKPGIHGHGYAPTRNEMVVPLANWLANGTICDQGGPKTD